MSEIADVGAMKKIEKSIAAARSLHPKSDPDGAWCQGWAGGWVTCLLETGQVGRRTGEMIRLGIEYGLQAALDGPCPDDAWINWSKLWAMIWSNSWCMELARSERDSVKLLRPEVIADRVLSTSLRIMRSMGHPEER